MLSFISLFYLIGEWSVSVFVSLWPVGNIREILWNKTGECWTKAPHTYCSCWREGNLRKICKETWYPKDSGLRQNHQRKKYEYPQLTTNCICAFIIKYLMSWALGKNEEPVHLKGWFRTLGNCVFQVNSLEALGCPRGQANMMAQPVKVLAAKTGDMSSIPRIRLVKGEN